MVRPTTARPHARQRRIVLFGEGPIAYRLADHLTRDHGATVSVIMPADDGRYAALIKERLPHMKVTVVARPNDWRFEEAGGHHAEAFVLVSEDDAANVAAWLAVRAMWPTKRVVVRIDDERLKKRLEQFDTDDPSRVYARTVHVLSPSAVLAPLLVASALGEPRPLNVPGADLLVGKPLPAEAGPEDNEGFEPLLGLFGQTERPPGSSSAQLGDRRETARVKRRQWNVRFRKRDRVTPLTESDVAVLPPKDSPRTRLVLGRWKRPSRRRGRRLLTTAELASAEPRPQHRGPRLFAFAKGLGGGVWMLAVVGLVLAVAGGITWSVQVGGEFWWSIYQAVVKALSGVEPAAADVDRADGWLPWLDIGLAALAATIVPVVTAAVITSWLFDRARLTNGRGPARRLSRHVVVVGLGDLGDKVLIELRKQRIRVVGVDIDPNAPGVATAHQLGVPVVIGDARNEQVMSDAQRGQSPRGTGILVERRGEHRGRPVHAPPVQQVRGGHEEVAAGKAQGAMDFLGVPRPREARAARGRERGVEDLQRAADRGPHQHQQVRLQGGRARRQRAQRVRHDVRDVPGRGPRRDPAGRRPVPQEGVDRRGGGRRAGICPGRAERRGGRRTARAAPAGLHRGPRGRTSSLTRLPTPGSGPDVASS